MTKIISFVNQKGGTGKTTACINIAAGMVNRKKKILLIDIDAQANSTLSLGIDPMTLNSSMYDVLLGNVPLKEIIQLIRRDGFSLAPAKMDLANADINLANEADNQFRLKEALAKLPKPELIGYTSKSMTAASGSPVYTGEYDYILIDCPPSLSLLTLNALVASDSVIIPVLCDYLSLEGLKQLLESIEKVRKGFNKALHVSGILPNMVDHRRNLTREVLSLLRANFKDLIFKEEIPVCVALAAAPSFGKDIFQYARWSSGGEAYRAVTREVIKRG